MYDQPQCKNIFTMYSTNLPLLGSGNPSSDHDICGVGFPAALHFKETAGPGCNVCSIKLYNNTGGASKQKRYLIIIG